MLSKTSIKELFNQFQAEAAALVSAKRQSVVAEIYDLLASVDGKSLGEIGIHRDMDSNDLLNKLSNVSIEPECVPVNGWSYSKVFLEGEFSVKKYKNGSVKYYANNSLEFVPEKGQAHNLADLMTEFVFADEISSILKSFIQAENDKSESEAFKQKLNGLTQKLRNDVEDYSEARLSIVDKYFSRKLYEGPKTPSLFSPKGKGRRANITRLSYVGYSSTGYPRFIEEKTLAEGSLMGGPKTSAVENWVAYSYI